MKIKTTPLVKTGKNYPKNRKQFRKIIQNIQKAVKNLKLLKK